MKKLILLSIVLLFQSCNIIHINESGYRSVKYMEKIHIKPFEAANQEEPCKNIRCRSVYEINSADILGLLDEQEYTWVHIWNPYCPDENCVNIGQFETLAYTYKNKGLKLVYISATYDIAKIFSIAENSSFTMPIYVLDGSYYGPKLKAIRQKLHMDLDKGAGEDDYFFQDDYVFKGDSLIYVGKEANDSIFKKLITDSNLSGLDHERKDSN